MLHAVRERWGARGLLAACLVTAPLTLWLVSDDGLGWDDLWGLPAAFVPALAAFSIWHGRRRTEALERRAER